MPIDARGTARKLVLDLAAPAPARPVITAAALAQGTWAGLLAELAAPYVTALWQLPAGAARIDGEPVSEKLADWLTRIDSAALTCSRRIEAMTRRHRQPAVAAPVVTVTPADEALAELTRLGVAPP